MVHLWIIFLQVPVCWCDETVHQERNHHLSELIHQLSHDQKRGKPLGSRSRILCWDINLRIICENGFWENSHLAQKRHVLLEEGNVEQHSKVIEKGELNEKERRIHLELHSPAENTCLDIYNYQHLKYAWDLWGKTHAMKHTLTGYLLGWWGKKTHMDIYTQLLNSPQGLWWYDDSQKMILPYDFLKDKRGSYI